MKLKSQSRRLPPGIQNMLEPGIMRNADQLRVRAVVHDGRFPFLVLSDSALGTLVKLRFVNGKSWDENIRGNFLTHLEQALRLESQSPFVDFTYSFSVVRRPIHPSEFEKFRNEDLPITTIRTDNLRDLSKKLEVQAVDLYFGITAAPSKLLQQQEVGLVDNIKSLWDKRIKYAVEAQLLEDVVLQFGDKVKQVLASFSSLGIRTELPRTEGDLLAMARKAWRPNYHEAEAALGRGGVSTDKLPKSLEYGVFRTPGDFLTRDMRVEQYKSHWISDGCLNILFSLEDAPDPNIPFSAFECDRLLAFGTRPGVNNIPYFGTYTVAWNSMTREDGDQKFRLKNAFAQGMVSDKKGFFEDKIAAKEARDVDSMHENYIEGGTDMVRASVMYQLSVPIEHINRFFDKTIDDAETVRSIVRTVKEQLSEVGFSNWRVEDRTYYPAWINSIPGTLRTTEKATYLPRIYLPLDGALHLVPLFATTGPDQDRFNGANYFITEDNSVFVFDHWSKANGAAANYSVLGSTGSGKSVVVQALVMMNEKDANIMVLDLGGGNVGSWTKLCAMMGGIELKFGSAKPPRINPFQLSMADALPNDRKKRDIAIALGLDHKDQDVSSMIDSVYIYIKVQDSPFTPAETKYKEMVERCPAMRKLPYVELMELLDLRPGYARPGEKGIAGIRVVLGILLASEVTENGPVDNAWHTFLPDDINDAIMRLYNDYIPPVGKADYWPTISDFRDTLERIHEERNARGTNRWGASGGIYQYPLLMLRLSNYCQGGMEPFLDGQTDVDIMRRETINGVKKEIPSRFILADMAGISDPRKLALYMIVINEFMSNILYNSKERRGILIRDECWIFMKSQIAAPYLEADYRLARKYGFSVISVAQNYSDFSSAVIQNNTQNWVVCGLSSEDEIALANRRFKFNDEEMELFTGGKMGLSIEKDVFSGGILEAYSRIMIANKSGKYFIKNKISNAERWITTTDDNETFIYNYYKDTKFYGRSVVDLINWLCTDEYLKDQDLRAAADKAGRRIIKM